MKKAIVLLRVSSKAQAGPDREGLAAQRTACERVAASHSLEIIDTVKLEGVSGAAVLGSPDFIRLLERLRSPDIAGVVVSDFDRLFRRGRFSDFAILDAFADSGSVLYSTEGVYDPSGDSGGLLGVIRGEMAGMERRNIAERTRRGRDEKRKRGLRAEGPVGMPRGVSFDAETETWSYVFPEAERVREAFRLFLDGVTNFADIRRRTGLGTATDSNVIQRVLRQPLYSGVYRVDRRWVNGKPVPRTPEDIEEYTVLDPPLIPMDDFQRAQRLLGGLRARRSPVKDLEDRPGTYGGFMVCGLCGAAMLLVTDSKGYSSYSCANTRHRKCSSGQISIRLADPQLDERLEYMLGSPEILRRLIEASAEESAKRAEAPPAETAKRITELRNQETRVKDAYVEGAFELPDLTKRIDAIRGEVSLLEDLLEREPAQVTVGEDVVAALVEVFCSWRDLTREEKRNLLTAYRVQMVVSLPQRREIKVVRVELGALPSFPSELRLYKKMKRLGIE